MSRLLLAVAMASSFLLAACGGGSARTPSLIGADCAAGRDGACASGNCLVLDSSTAYCSQGTLALSNGTLGSAVKVCFPDGGGGVGSACAFGPAACQSHLCLKKESGNVCTRACTVDTDCLGKWTCGEEKMPDGTALHVCLPPGTLP